MIPGDGTPGDGPGPEAGAPCCAPDASNGASNGASHGASHGAARATLSEEVFRRTGRNPARCYQCGKCSAGCPMAEETDLRPHDVMRLVGMDRRGDLLGSESLWLCLGCETCTARCPNDCDPAMVIDTLRAMALRQSPEGLPRALSAFHRTFLDQIRTHGRISELGLMVRYKMRTGALFQDATAGPGMVSRGKLHLTPPSNISGVDEVRAIFERCKEEPR